jgi:prefoldin subunit 5
VFSIQSIMLVALGFLSAGLVALVIAPAFWARAVRMTDKRLRERLPVTEDEVRAEKDRIRAEAAMRIHKLETRLEQAELVKARHRIELSRRDDSIATLERSISGLTSTLDEHQNARRVLEQTVSDRLPKVEQRLTEAKGLLFNRDREIAELTQSTKRQQIALEEATSINTQQNSEMKRLSSALTTRGARNGQGVADPKFESELALRAEIEALRTKTSEQASLINRLQSQMSGGGVGMSSLTDLVASAQAGVNLTPIGRGLNAAANANGVIERGSGFNASNSISFLTDEANERVAALSSDLRTLQTRYDEQASEVVRLSAELKTYQSETTADPNTAKDSRIALKARLSAVEAVSETQVENIKKLRAELAGANERLALQAAHFMDEMRRLGAGTLPTGGQQRRPVAASSRPTLAERVTQARPVNGGPLEADAPPVAVTHALTSAVQAVVGDAAHVEPGAVDDQPRPRLLDRISSLGKS